MTRRAFVLALAGLACACLSALAVMCSGPGASGPPAIDPQAPRAVRPASEDRKEPVDLQA